MSTKPHLLKTKWGFYQYAPLPAPEELETYYSEKYYQEGKGSYDVSYTMEEQEWFRLRARLHLRMFGQLHPACDGLKMLDAGCGEGWLANAFAAEGFGVTTIDYSSFGIGKFHPNLLPAHRQGDILLHVRALQKENQKFDFISICNVLEHVLDPVELINLLKSLLNKNGLLLISVPNDFSRLHEHLAAAGHITKQWWLAYPDHLSYFNKESLTALANDLGLEALATLSDHPIDLLLMHDLAKYIDQPDKGKAAHYYRCRVDNFLGSIDEGLLLKLYSTLGEMGVGRDLNIYFRHKC